jgi:hypothetical protein
LCAKLAFSFRKWAGGGITPPVPIEFDLGRYKRWRGTEK